MPALSAAETARLHLDETRRDLDAAMSRLLNRIAGVDALITQEYAPVEPDPVRPLAPAPAKPFVPAEPKPAPVMNAPAHLDVKPAPAKPADPKPLPPSRVNLSDFEG